MDPTVLIRLMRTGTISLQATVESELSKLRKQKNRKAKKLAEKAETESRGYLSLSRFIQKRYDCGDNVTWNAQRKFCYQNIQLERNGTSTRTVRTSRSTPTTRTSEKPRVRTYELSSLYASRSATMS